MCARQCWAGISLLHKKIVQMRILIQQDQGLFGNYADLLVDFVLLKQSLPAKRMVPSSMHQDRAERQQKKQLQMLDRYVSSLYSRMMVVYMVIQRYVNVYMNSLNPVLDCSKICDCSMIHNYIHVST